MNYLEHVTKPCTQCKGTMGAVLLNLEASEAGNTCADLSYKCSECGQVEAVQLMNEAVAPIIVSMNKVAAGSKDGLKASDVDQGS